mmetsp:Transcript_7789/g.27040  ORF Transcript_7789/g.27040 Transcript_7789/m.27040 type:complete len:150 (-) Transcript_7789:1993-2442(-)
MSDAESNRPAANAAKKQKFARKADNASCSAQTAAGAHGVARVDGTGTVAFDATTPVETRRKGVDPDNPFAVTRTVTGDESATEKVPAPAGDATSDAKTSGAKTHDAQTTDEHAKATSAKAPAKAPADDVKDKTTEVLVRQYKAFTASPT